MNLPLASASRPIASCCTARSDHARHQSFQDAIPAVTSSKSVSATPLATKRGAQCAMADLTSASMKFPSLIVALGRCEQSTRTGSKRGGTRGRERRIRLVVHRIEPRRRAVDLQVKNVRPIVMAGEIMTQLHLHAELEIALRIEDALLGAHRPRQDAAVRPDDDTAAAAIRIAQEF